MQIDISKTCSDFLRSDFATQTGDKLKASHSRELVAAFFGYKSHAALLAEKTYPLDSLGDAAVLVPNIPLMDVRRNNLDGLPSTLDPSRVLATKLSEFLKQQGHFSGEAWVYESLSAYVTEVLLIEKDGLMLDLLSGVMAETNAYFDSEFGHYESAEVDEQDDRVVVEVEGQYCGTSDTERPFCGDTIDVKAKVELYRVAGRAAFSEPDVSAHGEVNDDWVDPELKYGNGAP
jgi:hypothetical protein